MPELPEVETIRCGLAEHIEGKKIIDVWCDSPRHLNYEISAYKKKVHQKIIESVKRRGKLLYFVLHENMYLAFHLKMTGQLVYDSQKHVVAGGYPNKRTLHHLPNKHTHYILTFEDEDRLFFNDVRRFGWAKILTKKEFDAELARFNFGPEPLSRDFSLRYFKDRIQQYKNRKIKQLLLDQKIIAGLGNIYCDEILFFAGIRPDRIAKTMQADDIERIYKGIQSIIPKAIECGGSSTSDYLDASGRKGEYGKYHQVYGRAGKSCPKCGHELNKIKVQGRTSTYCPKCQK